jgi:thymidylate kinase
VTVHGADGPAAAVDAAIERRVVVVGSLPPGGRDLDLLVRAPERAAIAEGLAAQVAAGTIELIAAASWGLPWAERDAVFAGAEPLPGLRHVCRPAAHHALLVCARRLARGDGERARKLLARAREEIERDPRAVDRARARAGDWRARRALALLLAELDGGAAAQSRASARAEQIALRLSTGGLRGRRRRPLIVAFSGLDGSGKSLQAATLRDSLERRGIAASVVWPPGQNVLFQMPPAIKRPLRALLAAVGRQAEAPAAAEGDVAYEPLPEQHPLLGRALTTVAALGQALALRRSAAAADARVAIFDRYALDAVVYVRHRWGGGRLESAIVTRLAPSPSCAFLLDVAPETAHARKRDYPLAVLHERVALYRELAAPLGVRVLDGERSPEGLAAEIEQTFLQAMTAGHEAGALREPADAAQERQRVS